VRLSPAEVGAITEAARETFGDGAIVRLFGSRVDDDARGGDIDLLIEVPGERVGIAYESRFLSALFERIDEQKVDLVLIRQGAPLPPFAAMVAQHAVRLS
jgi:predicted nucleotidyltransferase